MEDFNINKKDFSISNDSLSISELSISINNKILFENTDLKLAKGNIYTLIAPNGAGKSTLLNYIYDYYIKSDNEDMIARVEQQVLDEDMDKTPIQVLLESNGRFFRIKKRKDYLESKLEDEDVEDDVIEEYERLENEISLYNEDQEISIIKNILRGMQFNEEMMVKPIELFSGGYRKRIMIAKILYQERDFIIMDEITNHLDLYSTLWISDYIINLASRTGCIILLVSHNIGFINSVTNVILNIENKKIVQYKGNYTKFRTTLLTKERNQEKEWTKLIKKKNKMSKKDFEELVKKSGLVKPEKDKKSSIKFLDAPFTNNNLVSLGNITFGYNDNLIFDGLGFDLNYESRIVLMGKNGTGKSTLLKLITSQERPLKGDVYVNGKARIGYYNQHFESFLDGNKTPIDFLKDNIPVDYKDQNPERIVRQYLGCMGLQSKLHNSLISTLSGGEQARVAFVYLIFQKPNLLLLDEPTNHLDIDTVTALISALDEYQGGILLITHDTELIERLNFELYELRDRNIKKYQKDLDEYIEENI